MRVYLDHELVWQRCEEHGRLLDHIDVVRGTGLFGAPLEAGHPLAGGLGFAAGGVVGLHAGDVVVTALAGFDVLHTHVDPAMEPEGLSFNNNEL